MTRNDHPLVIKACVPPSMLETDYDPPGEKRNHRILVSPEDIHTLPLITTAP